MVILVLSTNYFSACTTINVSMIITKEHKMSQRAKPIQVKVDVPKQKLTKKASMDSIVEPKVVPEPKNIDIKPGKIRK